jgi:hypothetical protein
VILEELSTLIGRDDGTAAVWLSDIVLKDDCGPLPLIESGVMLSVADLQGKKGLDEKIASVADRAGVSPDELRQKAEAKLKAATDATPVTLMKHRQRFQAPACQPDQIE